MPRRPAPARPRPIRARRRACPPNPRPRPWASAPPLVGGRGQPARRGSAPTPTSRYAQVSRSQVTLPHVFPATPGVAPRNQASWLRPRPRLMDKVTIHNPSTSPGYGPILPASFRTFAHKERLSFNSPKRLFGHCCDQSSLWLQPVGILDSSLVIFCLLDTGPSQVNSAIPNWDSCHLKSGVQADLYSLILPDGLSPVYNPTQSPPDWCLFPQT